MTIYANNVAGTLAGNIGPSDTLILLGTGQGAAFPLPAGGDFFYATLQHVTTGVIEIVQCTARAGDTLTVVRGRDGTAATSFTSGSVVELRLCAQMLRDIDIRALRGVANGYASLDAGAKIPVAQIPAAVALDADVTALLAGKQDSLGYTPVQQGTGVGQLGNAIKIGWSGTKTKLTVDSTDWGNIALEAWVSANHIATTARGAANGVASLDATTKIPAAQIPTLAYLSTAGGTITGNLTVNGNFTLGGVVSGGMDISGDLKVYRTATPATGAVILNSAGTRSLFFDGTDYILGSANTKSLNFIATSDRRTKKHIRKHAVPAGFADQIQLKSWLTREGNLPGYGVVAQEVQTYAPHHVQGTKTLGVDKAGLALDAIVDLAARVRKLEKAR